MSTGSARLRLGARASRLALWQADHVTRLLRGLVEAPSLEIVRIKTAGDRIRDVALSTVEGRAFFTKEIEQALLEDRVDLAVHSLKDLATRMPAGLELGAVLEREDPRDVLLSRQGKRLEELAPGARVGTSSLRRRALLARWRPDLKLVDLRGNVPTRIRKLGQGQFDAIVLAAAGVKRLDLEEEITQYLPVERVLPAVSQGAIAVQVRTDDEATGGWVRQLEHAPTRFATVAERSLLGRLEGGCQVPVGALGSVLDETLNLRAVLCSLDGRRAIEGHRSGPVGQAGSIGLSLAEELLERGGDAILEEIRAGQREAS
ncbi:MAG: hydroxymethylbilane synthase [Thermoanaerobaculia bacterium]